MADKGSHDDTEHQGHSLDPRFCVFEQHYKGTLGRIEEHTEALREKVFNGLSALPDEIKWIRRTLIGLLVAAVLALGSSVWSGIESRAQNDRPTTITEATILDAVIREAVIRQAVILEAAKAAAEAAAEEEEQ